MVASTASPRQGRDGSDNRGIRSPPRRLGYAPQLNGLRALAIIMVVLLHAAGGHFPGGWLGVDVFFVLSGFLITSLLTGEHDGTGSISFHLFYLRRIFRLTPALAVFVAVAFWWAVAHHAAVGSYRHYLVYVITYRANFYDAVPPGGVGHLWSLATEDQFYLVWPVVLWGCLRLGGRTLATAVSLTAAAASFGIGCLLVAHHVWVYRIYSFGPEVNAQALLIGCAVGLLYTGRLLDRFASMKHLRSCTIVVAALLGLGIFAPNWLTAPWMFAGPFLIYALMVAFVITGAMLQPRGITARILSLRLVVWVGKLSYSIYLWHVWVFFVVPGPGVRVLAERLALTAVLSVASYYGVERFGLWIKDRYFEPSTVGAPLSDGVLPPL